MRAIRMTEGVSFTQYEKNRVQLTRELKSLSEFVNYDINAARHGSADPGKNREPDVTAE